MNVHDLVKLNSIRASKFDRILPEWAKDSLKTMPYVVIRRGKIKLIRGKKYLPIGIRGENRDKRFGCYMMKEKSDKVISPEQIVKEKMWTNSINVGLVQAVSQLDKIFSVWENKLDWGLVGSVGYELATKRKATGCQSDLDLLIKPKSKMPISQAKDLLDELMKLTDLFKLLDLTIQTPKGLVNFKEYVISKQKVLIKTNKGEKLVRNIW